MRIQTLSAGPIATNGYLLIDEPRREALLVDAPHEIQAEIAPLLQSAGAHLVALLVTHGHWDHIGDAAAIQQTGVPLHAHAEDRLLIEMPEVQHFFSLPGVVTPPAQIEKTVADGDRLELAGQVIEVRHVPGHCPGNVAYYFADLGAVFVGDSLFAGGIGRPDLPGGDFGQLQQAIRTRIYSLPADTVVYPGHGPATTVGEEMSSNPYVR